MQLQTAAFGAETIKDKDQHWSHLNKIHVKLHLQGSASALGISRSQVRAPSQ